MSIRASLDGPCLRLLRFTWPPWHCSLPTWQVFEASSFGISSMLGTHGSAATRELGMAVVIEGVERQSGGFCAGEGCLYTCIPLIIQPR